MPGFAAPLDAEQRQAGAAPAPKPPPRGLQYWGKEPDTGREVGLPLMHASAELQARPGRHCRPTLLSLAVMGGHP